MKNTKIHGLFTIMIIGFMTGCFATSQISDADVLIIEYERLVELLNNPKHGTVLVDVRPPAQYAKSHIPGAINIPINKLRPAHPRLVQAKNIVVYSQGITDMLSRAANKTLLRSGYKNVHNFQGGLNMWKNLHHQQVQ